MRPFEWNLETLMVVGAGQFSRLGEVVKPHGKRAVLVTGQHAARKHGWIDAAKASLKKAGVECFVYEGVQSNPRTVQVDAAAKVARDNRCDVVIGLGGGSVMDASKLVAAVALSGRKAADYLQGCESGAWKELLPIEKALPIVEVATTAATGAEGNTVAVITNPEAKEKCVVWGPAILPKAAIVDAEFTTTMPPDVTAGGAVDIISHVLESYLAGTDKADVQDRMTEGLMHIVMDYTGRAIKNGKDIEARENLSWASTLALCQISNAGRGTDAWPLHFIQHCAAAYCDFHHGQGIAFLMPAYLNFVKTRRPDRLAKLGKRLFNAQGADAADQFTEKFSAWLKDIGLDKGLSDFGITESQFKTIAADVVRLYGPGDGTLPGDEIGPLSTSDIVGILKAAL